MIKLIASNLKRIMVGKMFGFAVIGIVVLETLDALPFILDDIKAVGTIDNATNVVRIFVMAGSTLYNLLVVTMCSLPAVGLFIEDYENHFIRNIVIRSSYRKYTVATMLSAAIGIFLCAMMGEGIFVFICRILFPIASNDETMYLYSIDTLRNGNYYLYILIMIILRSLRGVFFGMISIMMSSIITNKFFIYSMPTIVYYLLMYITVDLPNMLGLDFLRRISIPNLFGIAQFGLDKELFSLWFTIVYVCITGIIMWIVYNSGVRRRCK